MALIPRIGGPNNTEQLQKLNKRGDNVEQATPTIQDLMSGAQRTSGTPQAPLTTPQALPPQFSAFGDMTPKPRQPGQAMQFAGDINASIQDAMGVEKAASPSVGITEMVKERQVPSAEAGGETQEARNARIQAENVAKSLEQAPKAAPVSGQEKEAAYLAGQEKAGLYTRTQEQQNAINKMVAAQNTAGAQTPAALSENTEQVESGIKKVLGAVDVNSPVAPPAPMANATVTKANYMENLNAIISHQTYNAKQQAKAEAASLGMGAQSNVLAEKYDTIDANMTQASMAAANTFLMTEMQLDYQTREAEAQRQWQSKEAGLDRSFKLTGQMNEFQQQMALAGFDRETQITLTQVQQAFASVEAQKDRIWQSNERLSGQNWEKMMKLSDYEFQKSIAAYDRDTQKALIGLKSNYDFTMQNRDIEFNKWRVKEEQQFTRTERMSTQDWQAGEAALARMDSKDVALLLQGNDLAWDKAKTEYTQGELVALETMRFKWQKEILGDEQSFAALEKMKDRDLSKFLSGSEIEARKEIAEFDAATQATLLEVRNKWQKTENDLDRKSRINEITETKNWDRLMKLDDQAFEKAIREEYDIDAATQKEIELYRINTQKEQFTDNLAWLKEDSANQTSLSKYLDASATDRATMLSQMSIDSAKNLQGSAQQFEYMLSTKDNDFKVKYLSLTTDAQERIMASEFRYNQLGKMLDKETEKEILKYKDELQKKYVDIEMNYKWAQQQMDYSINSASASGIFKPITGWQTAADGTFALGKDGRPIPLYGEAVTTIGAWATQENIMIDKSNSSGYLWEMKNGTPSLVMGAEGKPIKVVSQKQLDIQETNANTAYKDYERNLSNDMYARQEKEEQDLWDRSFTGKIGVDLLNTLVGAGSTYATKKMME